MSPTSNAYVNDSLQHDEVQVERVNGSVFAKLNRPKALNALNLPMVHALARLIKVHPDTPSMTHCSHERFDTDNERMWHHSFTASRCHTERQAVRHARRGREGLLRRRRTLARSLIRGRTGWLTSISADIHGRVATAQ